jgi:hypothetical protein
LGVGWHFKRRVTAAAAAMLACALTFALGACNKGEETPLTPAEQSEASLKELSSSLLKNLHKTISVLAVVDHAAPAAAGAQGGEPAVGATGQDSAIATSLARERIVRAALTSVLVGNSKFVVIDPPDTVIREFYQILSDKNANALSVDEARRAGIALSVDAVVTAFVEDDGKRVDVAATSTETGKVVFHEILVDWDYKKLTDEEKSAQAENKK